MADKIVVMHDGVVEQVGAPLDLYDRPDNLFVAGFIGSPAMNFLKGKVAGESFRTDGGLTLPLPSRGARPADGMPAVYGLRPEHVQLSATGVPVEVAVVERPAPRPWCWCARPARARTRTSPRRPAATWPACSASGSPPARASASASAPIRASSTCSTPRAAGG